MASKASNPRQKIVSTELPWLPCVFLQESGLYEYKTLGVMADLNPEMCAQVYVDWEYRKVWDSYVLGERRVTART